MLLLNFFMMAAVIGMWVGGENAKDWLKVSLLDK